MFLATRCDTIPDDRLADVDLNFFLARTLIGALPVRDTTVDNGYGCGDNTPYSSVAVCNGCYNKIKVDQDQYNRSWILVI